MGNGFGPITSPWFFISSIYNLFLNNVLQSECQQLICEILRATPEAASADAAVQTARLASKVPTKEKRQVTRISCDNTCRKRKSKDSVLVSNAHLYFANRLKYFQVWVTFFFVLGGETVAPIYISSFLPFHWATW